MKITQEADYAIRMAYCLAKNGKTDAKTLSSEAVIPARFALKILRKLMDGGIVESVIGAGGGYKLSRAPKEISIRQILEIIDGPITFNRCVANTYECSRVSCKQTCPFHLVFTSINKAITERLDKINLALVLEYGCGVSDIL